jgi:RNA polymerase sigma-70 factor, ECF subfamily
VQQATLKVMEICRRREGNAPLAPSYLHKVAYTVMVDEMRRGSWRREVPLEGEGTIDPPARPDGDPERAALAGELTRGIHGCLSSLVEPRLLAVTLHLQGYSVAEAAELLAFGLKRTENLVYRGLADLRRCLAAKGLAP